jgi:hypothetical protein
LTVVEARVSEKFIEAQKTDSVSMRTIRLFCWICLPL